MLIRIWSPPPLPDDLTHGTLQGFSLFDITVDGQSLTASLFDLTSGFLQLRYGASQEGNLGAMLGQSQCDALPNPLSRPCDECHFVFKHHDRVVFLSLMHEGWSVIGPCGSVPFSDRLRGLAPHSRSSNDIPVPFLLPESGSSRPRE